MDLPMRRSVPDSLSLGPRPISRSRNFETTGQRPWLYFTRFKYPGCEQAQGRDLVRVPLEIRK